MLSSSEDEERLNRSLNGPEELFEEWLDLTEDVNGF